jgi:putative RNA 2'-phosphotransferase
MNLHQITKISRFLSLVLRHEPGKIGITLDGEGWTSVDELIAAMNAHGQPLDFEILEHVVDTNNKKRFAFSDDGERIRASQGHSVEVDLGYVPAARMGSRRGCVTTFISASACRPRLRLARGADNL